MSAQCTVGSATGMTEWQVSVTTSFVGQTFQARSNGFITSIRVGLHSNNTSGHPNAMLYIENGIGDGTADYSQTVSFPIGTNQSFTINLDTPFLVVAGNTYTFYFGSNTATTSNTLAFLKDSSNPYAGGHVWYNNSEWTSSGDLNFTVTTNSACVSSGGDVPTLSEWGLIILALLLMTLGTLYLVQPNWRRRFEQ